MRRRRLALSACALGSIRAACLVPRALLLLGSLVLAARGARAQCAADQFLEAGEEFAYTGDIELTGWGNLASAYNQGATYVYQSPGSYTRQGYSGPSWFYRYSAPWDGYLTWQNSWAATAIGYSTDQVSWCLVFYITSNGQDYNDGCFVPSIGKWVDSNGNVRESVPPASVASPHNADVCTACPVGSTSPAGSDAVDDCVCRENSVYQPGTTFQHSVDLLQGQQFSTSNSVNFPGSDNWVDTQAFTLTLLNSDGTSLLACERDYCYEVDLTGATPLITLRFTTPESSESITSVVTSDFSRIFLFEDNDNTPVIYSIDTTTWTWIKWQFSGVSSMQWQDAVITSDNQYIYACDDEYNIWKISLSTSCLTTFVQADCAERWIIRDTCPGTCNGFTGVALSRDDMTLFAYALYGKLYKIDVNTKGITVVSHGCSDLSQGRIRMLSDGQTLYVMGRNQNWGKGLFDTTTNSWIGSPCYLGVSPSPYDNNNMQGMAVNQWDIVFILTNDRYLFSIDLVTRQAGCPCNSGYADNAGTCTACAAGTYEDAGTCTACFTGSMSPAGSDAVEDCVCIDENSALQAGAEAGSMNLLFTDVFSTAESSRAGVAAVTAIILLQENPLTVLACGTNECMEVNVEQGVDPVMRLSGLNSVHGLAFTSDKSTLFLLENNGNIYKVDPTTWTRNLWSNDFGSMSDADIAIAHDDSFMIVSDRYAHKIDKIDLTGSCFTTYASSCRSVLSNSAFYYPQSVSISPDDSNVIVYDQNAMKKIVISTGSVTTIADNNDFQCGSNCGDANMRYTPDGNSIVFVSQFAGNVYITNTLGTITSEYPISEIPASSYSYGIRDFCFANNDKLIFPGTSSGAAKIYDFFIADQASTCPCLSGYVDNAGTCTAACAAGSYGTASDACTACPAPQTSPAGSDAAEDCGCDAGGYYAPAGIGSINSALGASTTIGTFTSSEIMSSITLNVNNAYFRHGHAVGRMDLSTGAQITIAGDPGTSGDSVGSGSNARFNFHTTVHPGPFAFNTDYTKFYIVDQTPSKLKEIDLNSPFTVSTLNDIGSTFTTGQYLADIFTFNDHLYLCAQNERMHKCSFDGTCSTVWVSSSGDWGWHCRLTPDNKVVWIRFKYLYDAYIMQNFANDDFTTTTLAMPDRMDYGGSLDYNHFNVLNDDYVIFTQENTNEFSLYNLNTGIKGDSLGSLANHLHPETFEYADGFIYAITAPTSSTRSLVKAQIATVNEASCTACPAGKTSLFGSDAEADCQCAAGSYLGSASVESINSGNADLMGTETIIGTPTSPSTISGSITFHGEYVYYRIGHSIERMHLTTGIVTHIAGSITTSGDVTGTGSNARFEFWHSQGPFAFNGDGSKLYVQDYYNNKVKEIDLTSSSFTVSLFYAIGNVGDLIVFENNLYLIGVYGKVDKCSIETATYASCTEIISSMGTWGWHARLTSNHKLIMLRIDWDSASSRVKARPAYIMHNFASGDHTLTDLWTTSGGPPHYMDYNNWDTLDEDNIVFSTHYSNFVVVYNAITDTTSNIGYMTGNAHYQGKISHHNGYMYAIDNQNLAKWKIATLAPGDCESCPAGGTSPDFSTSIADCQCGPGYTGTASCDLCAENTIKPTSGSDACTPCAAGTVSNAGRTACVCGYGQEPDGAGGCEPCPLNHYKSAYSDDACLECHLNSATDSTGTDADYLCKCIPGYYNSDSQTNDCEPCATGTYKTTTANLEACVACPTGSTTLTTAHDEVADCICDVGYTGTGGASCVACAVGEYKASAGSTPCTTCPTGSTSPEASDASADCVCESPAYTGPAGGPCACSAGYYNTPCELCTADYYCLGGETRTSCPLNAVSPAGSDASGDCQCGAGYTGDASSCSQCLADEYKDAPGSDACSACPPDTQSPAGSTDLGLCAANAGYYLSGGTASACPANSDSAVGSTAATDCKCNVGHTGPDGGPCTACEAGQYKATPGSDPCAECTSNSHSAGGSTASTDCACNAGYTGPDGGACAACAEGEYKQNTGSATCSDCASNSNSPSASDAPTGCVCNVGYSGLDGGTCSPCATGTYKDSTGSSDCLACPDNSDSPAESTAITACACNSGYAGADGDPCVACLAGQYEDTAMNACDACPDNSNSPASSDAVTDCLCNAGYSGLDGGTCQVCGSGTYKAAPGSSACTPCHDNSISPAGSTSAGACLCQAGYYKLGENCVGCDYGFYKEGISDATACTQCILGNTPQPASTSINDCYCGAGTYLSVQDPFECDICPPDAYTNTQNTATSCTQCPVNTKTSGPASDEITDCLCTYDFTGLDGGTCTECESGKYKAVLGSSACLDCPSGSTCTWNPDASSKVVTCNAGYTVDGSGCTACVAGKYKAVTGADTCDNCPGNSVSPLASTALTDCQCNAGYSGPDGGECTQCTPNTYNDVIGASGCLACMPYSTSPAGSDNVTDCVCDSSYIHAGDGSCDRECAAGFEANAEESSCVGCGNSHYKPAAGDESCTPCPEHSSHSLYNQTSIEACACQQGYIFNSGTESCDACAAGTFNNYAGETMCFDCFSATAGSCEASDSGTQSCTDICQAEAGYQITASGTNLEMCPAHTYNDGSYTTCQTCPVGSDTTAEGSTSVLDCACQAGYFRNAESVCEACPVGEIKTSTGEAACSACPADMTTLSTASTACVCAAGFEPNAENTACQACPAGEAKFVAGNASCILCTEHATLQSDLPHTESSCLCDPGYTGSHLDCSPCDTGTYKSTFGPDACTNCTEFATTPGPASTDISACACVALYEPGPDSGPGESGGSCVSSCAAGTYQAGDACAPCEEGAYKAAVGPEACTPCAPPRNASRVGAASADACSCRAGEIALGGGAATLLAVSGLDASETAASPCAANPCVHTTGHLLPLHRVLLNAAAVQAAPVASLTVTVARAGVPLVFFSCATPELCAGVSEVDLRGVRADTVTVEVAGGGSYAPSIAHYLRATATFAGSETLSAWDQAAAERVVLAQDVQVGESVFDSATAVLEAGLCVPCAGGLVCGPHV